MLGICTGATAQRDNEIAGGELRRVDLLLLAQVEPQKWVHQTADAEVREEMVDNSTLLV